jgi:carboxylesterase type B
VVAQTIANQDFEGPATGGRFAKALASSPFWPKTYGMFDAATQWNYDTMVNRSGCASAANTLSCLKAADVQTLRDASLYVAGSHTYNTTSYTWGPVIDGRFLTRTLSAAATEKKINPASAWGMYNTHEGENFIPAGLATAAGSGGFNSSTASFEGWLAGFLPGLSDCERRVVQNKYYPVNGSTDTLDSYSGVYTQAGLIYRDVVLACPAYWTAGAAAVRSYLGEYTISPAKHGSDTYWVRQPFATRTGALSNR